MASTSVMGNSGAGRQVKGAGVGTKSLAYLRMEQHWKLTDALLGGTQAMRDAGQEFLPKEPREKATPYRNRLGRSFLFNGYKDTVDGLAAKPFGRAVTLKGAEKLDPKLKMIEANADRQGTTLTMFARQVLHEAIHRGLSHILVDFPIQDPNSDAGEELERRVHPNQP